MSTEARRPAPRPESPAETTTRLRPVPDQPPAGTPAPPAGHPAARTGAPPVPRSADSPTPRATSSPLRPDAPSTAAPAAPAGDAPESRPVGRPAASAAPCAHGPAAPSSGAPAAKSAPHGPDTGRPAAPGTGAAPSSPTPGDGRPAAPAPAPPPARPPERVPGVPGAAGRPAPPPAAPGVVPPSPAAPSFPAQPPAGAFPPVYEAPCETTVRLRPVRGPRRPARVSAAIACLVLGLGLTAGAAAGSWTLRDSAGAPGRTAYTEAATLWHSTPVDTLFPPALQGEGAGPGGADRTWTRVAVAPDAPCATVLQPRLAAALAPAGCLRVLRATYTDATSSSVTTVGMVFMETDAAGMTALHDRFTDGGLDESPELMPPALAAPGTVAARFGNAQRASWHVNVLTEVPVVVYGVSGFADGRAVPRPQPARQAMAKGETTAPAQAGLGHEARGVADRVEQGLRAVITRATEGPARKEDR